MGIGCIMTPHVENVPTCTAISRGVPVAARELIWDVFFRSRQRGISLSTHFPWIEQSIGTYCVLLSDAYRGAVLATLVLREVQLASLGRCAMVGMVAVDSAWRGQGLSRQLLTRALAFATEQQLATVVLWTGQPGIYKSHGFVPDACDSFGQVTLNNLRPRAQVRFSRGAPDAARGLPPFAQQLISVESSAAKLIAVETAQGVALAEWQGALPAVLDLIEAALPTSWGLNAQVDSQIFDEIRIRGHRYTPLPCAKRMLWHRSAPLAVPYISVLDRI